MRVSRLHLDTSLQIGAKVPITGSRAHYLQNVLRLKSGQQIILFDGKQPVDFHAELLINHKTIQAHIHSSTEKQTEAPINVCLYQALGRSENMDFILQKGTELGVKQFYFFNCERTQSPLKGERLEKKLKHWDGIVISASEQCNRNIVPQIYFTHTLQKTLTEVSHGILLNFSGKPLASSLKDIPQQNSVSLFVGPEGGFNPEEIDQINSHGIQSCTLGPRVLRMETASISAIALIQATLGDLN